MDIQELIGRGESEDLEFKKSLSEMKEILKTVCAFANSKGGIILIGVDDYGNIIGVDIGRKTIEDLIINIERNIKPKIYPEISILTFKEKKIIKITVPEGKEKPYFFKGVAYKRVGKNTIKMDPHEITETIIEKSKLWELTEKKIVGNLKDIDLNKVRDIIKKIFIMRKIKFEGDEISFLRKIEVLDDKNNVTLAGVLLFGKNPQGIVPFASIKAMRKVGEKILDEKLIEGTLDEQIESSLEFIRTHIPKEITIEGGKRIEKWAIPEEVIRELIVNAIVHRDYSIQSPILIKYTDNEITIINPGGLLPPLEIEDLYKEHPSILRNPTIARILFLLGYIEGWGEGTLRIVKICRKNDIPIPIFEEKKGFFYAKIKVIQKSLDKNEKIAIEMAKRGVTSKELAKKLKISERTARDILRKLYEKGLLKRERRGRMYIYYL